MDIDLMADVIDFLIMERAELLLKIEKELQIINLEQQIDILTSF